jgi:hypothetical protein
MNNLWISMISILIGIIPTIIISRYFYKRSIQKSLTPYIQFFSSPIRGIDPQVRKELFVKYQDYEIENLLKFNT